MIWNLGGALGALALVLLHWVKTTPGLVIATILGLLVTLLTIRKTTIKRYIVLEEDRLLLPTGFLQRRVVQIPYDTILDVWESRWEFGTVLYIRTAKKKYEIPCGIRVNREDYVVIKDFLMERREGQAQPAG